ncbi:MAG: class I SAM-dependent methyltransferase [Polyangiales bacterium]
MYEYDSRFLSYGRSIATKSAQAVVPIVRDALHPRSVLDLGCGRGAWLEAWKDAGVSEVLGVDGNYVDEADLAIDRSEFSPRDLGRTVDLQRRFDLVESLEVAEHLPESRARGFVQDLCRHGDRVLFGAAPPGQGGEHHINEQPYGYWRALFDELGYEPFDFVRPHLTLRQDVAPWYRYNTLLYVKREAIEELPVSVRRTHLAKHMPIRDVSPLLYKARKRVVRRLPEWATQALANLAKRMPR